MKITHFPLLVFTPVSLLALAAGGCKAKDPAVATTLPTVSAAAAMPAPVAAMPVAPTLWADIEVYTYEMRAPFLAGVTRLEVMVEGQLAELNARRATLAPVAGTADAKAWDFAMKEMDEARSYLKATGKEAGEATADTWKQQKEKVGQAWTRTQAAYEKVKASITG